MNISTKILNRTLLLAFGTLMCTFVVAQTPHTDTPQQGEGLGAFLLRNGYNVSKYKDKFIELNANRFGKDYGLLLGVKYVFPEKQNQIEEPLLGEANKMVTIEDDELYGATYYLISGHGGPDPGAIAKVGEKELHEDEYAYDVMLRLAKCLLSHNAKVHIIIQDPNDGIRDDAYLSNDDHETCVGAAIPLDQNERLQQRCDAVNNFYKTERTGYCRTVIIHLDSRTESTRIDVFAYHFTKSKMGQRLAQNVIDKLKTKYDYYQPGRGFLGEVKERQLYVLRETNPPAMFLELGNIQNDKDRLRFIKPSNRKAVAEWVAEGMIEDFKMSK